MLGAAVALDALDHDAKSRNNDQADSSSRWTGHCMARMSDSLQAL